MWRDKSRLPPLFGGDGPGGRRNPRYDDSYPTPPRFFQPPRSFSGPGNRMSLSQGFRKPGTFPPPPPRRDHYGPVMAPLAPAHFTNFSNVPPVAYGNRPSRPPQWDGGLRAAPGNFGEGRFIQQHPVIRNHHVGRFGLPADGLPGVAREPSPTTLGKRKHSLIEEDDTKQTTDSLDIDKALDTWPDSKRGDERPIGVSADAEESSSSGSEEAEDEEDLDVEAAEEQIDRLDALISHWERLLERRRELDKAHSEESHDPGGAPSSTEVKDKEEMKLEREGGTVEQGEHSVRQPTPDGSRIRDEREAETLKLESSTLPIPIGDYEPIYKHNRNLAEKHNQAFPVSNYTPGSTKHQWRNLPSSSIIENYIIPRRTVMDSKIQDLRQEFETRWKSYRKRVQRINERRTFGDAVFGPTVGGANAQATNPEFSGGGPANLYQMSYSSRSRRVGSSDMVRSEAEFEAILRRLQQSETDGNEGNQDRWAKNVDMVLDPDLRTAMETDDRSTLVEDPESELALQRAVSDDGWTGAEKYIFRTKLEKYGKEFNTISKYLPNKTTQDCVFFYYRGKYIDNLKEAVRRHKIQNGHGRRRKTAQPKSAKPADRIDTLTDGYDLPTSRSRSSRLDEGDYSTASGSRAARAKQRAANQAAAEEMETAGAAAGDEIAVDADDVEGSGMTWTEEELELLTTGFRQHGKDFAATAALIEGWTARDVRDFFNSQKRRLNLMELVKEAESEKKPPKKPRSSRDKTRAKRKAAPSEEIVTEIDGDADVSNEVAQEPGGAMRELLMAATAEIHHERHLSSDSKKRVSEPTTDSIIAAAQALQGLLTAPRTTSDGHSLWQTEISSSAVTSEQSIVTGDAPDLFHPNPLANGHYTSRLEDNHLS
ncbi:hypothetical protein M427DRAFT_41482 [Gonapodya prolifera JEL478]|uniref:SANT domain-containing protein n=1 Tax=Gonapodya prolifera (strain JEL478) TaxID=1344416 RepID=A0A139ATW5_GONPJ|nr:hypothetical protein M427DRAFT_41482 [Gonapodya prolifera JEL478]|eukprot:KXS20180.1 hypothetical protein M427DRAFT_41482 [Gonapodya prolifera JEL478]